MLFYSGCPMIIKVADPTGKLMMSGDSMTRGVVEQTAFSIMQTQGAVIDVAQVQTKVTGLTGDLKSRALSVIVTRVYGLKINLTGWLCERSTIYYCQCQCCSHQLFQVLRRIWYDCMSDECMAFLETFNALFILLSTNFLRWSFVSQERLD